MHIEPSYFKATTYLLVQVTEHVGVLITDRRCGGVFARYCCNNGNFIVFTLERRVSVGISRQY